MPYQLELKEVSPLAAHSNYSIELIPHNNPAKTLMLERCCVVTVNLSRCTIRSVVKHNDVGIQVDLKGTLRPSDARSFHKDIGCYIASKRCKSIARLGADVESDVES